MPSTPGIWTNLFADDTMFMTTSMSIQHAVDKLQTQIDTTLPWLKGWRLTLNTDKTLAIKFGRSGLKHTTPLKIHDQDISWRPSVKYLGVYLDSRLKLNRHVAEITKKAKSIRAALYPILNARSPIPVRAKINIYKMYVKSILTYAGPAWAALISNTSWKNIEAIQNISLRTITGSPWFVKNQVISDSTRTPSIRSTISLNSKILFHKLHLSRHNHLAQIGKIIGPATRNRKRPSDLINH